MPEFVLDAHAAQSCPVKVQNQFNPLLEPPGERAIDEGLAEIFARGRDFEDAVVATMLETFRGTVLDARTLREQPWDAQEAACGEAMTAGVDLIVGGVVPRDLAAHRSGRPTMWLRIGATSDGRPGYAPIKVKAHPVHERRQSGKTVAYALRCSTLAAPRPSEGSEVDSVTFRATSREGDLLQAAHYWRLLEAAGHAAAGTPLAGIVGTDKTASGEPVVTWVDLSEKQIRTFSRTAEARWRLRSALERYDHEHQFRVRVAQQAALQGREGAPSLMVSPIVVRECESCRWWETCRPLLPDEDISLRIDKSPLDVREISVLRSLGIATVSELAEVDLEELLPAYLPEVAHRPMAEDRVRLAARRARMLARGVALEREGSGPVPVPEARVEIDFDVETSSDDHVYLWGFFLRGGFDEAGEPIGPEGRFVPFVEFEDLSPEAEIALALRAVRWLRRVVEECGDVRVYHYSDYELVRLRRLASASQDPDLLWALEWARENFVDLFAIVRRHFFGAHGLGLKVVAHDGAGFTWRDDDPGGLNSQRWFDDAVHADSPEVRAAAAQRVLEYNEDDVRATDSLRTWLRALP